MNTRIENEVRTVAGIDIITVTGYVDNKKVYIVENKGSGWSFSFPMNNFNDLNFVKKTIELIEEINSKELGLS